MEKGQDGFHLKPGKEYTATKNYSSFRLTLSISVSIEKLVKRYIQDQDLEGCLMYRGQYAFHAGCSVKTTLHPAVFKVEQQLDQGTFLEGTFFDIKSVFGNPSLSPSTTRCYTLRDSNVRGHGTSFWQNLK